MIQNVRPWVIGGLMVGGGGALFLGARALHNANNPKVSELAKETLAKYDHDRDGAIELRRTKNPAADERFSTVRDLRSRGGDIVGMQSSLIKQADGADGSRKDRRITLGEMQRAIATYDGDPEASGSNRNGRIDKMFDMFDGETEGGMYKRYTKEHWVSRDQGSGSDYDPSLDPDPSLSDGDIITVG